MEKSSLKLVSNIMLKSKFKKTSDSYISYLPFDLLPRVYNDVRSETCLSDFQRTQKIKILFAAEYTMDDNSDDS